MNRPGAPTGNTNATKDGYSAKIRIRVANKEHLDLINEMLSTEARGEALLRAAMDAETDALIIVADCERCEEPITAAEPVNYWKGRRVCESCLMIAIAASE